MLTGTRPDWLTLDCYGTLIQWDEGLLAAIERILARTGAQVEPDAFIAIYDRHEHRLEREPPHRSFRDVSAIALHETLTELGIAPGDGDAEILTESIGKMPPFPEAVPTLTALKAAGFRLCIISNTDDGIIAGNLAQLGGTIDRVITAEQAGAYKPSHRIFEFAHRAIGVTKDRLVHVCASPHLDLVATRALGIRDVWIDRGTGRQPEDGYAPAARLSSLDGLIPLFRSTGWL